MAFPQVTFVSTKHPRGQHGRFAFGGAHKGGAPSFSQVTVQHAEPLRSPTRNSRVWAIGAATREVPASYTASPKPDERHLVVQHVSAHKLGYKLAGSRGASHGVVPREHEEGTFTHHSFTPQIPKKMPVEQYTGLMRKLGAAASGAMKPTIEKALTEGVRVPTHKMSGPKHMTWSVPDGTSRATMKRAYVHATKLAMHEFGAVDYDFKMDEPLKAEMKSVEPFIRHAQRRVGNELNAAAPGQWRQFREEFGQKFPKSKIDKRPGSPTFGQERLRVRPNKVLVKLAKVAAAPPAQPAVPAVPAAAAAAPAATRPGVLPVNSVAPTVSRFDRYRAYLARDESAGIRSTKMLTPAQKLQRLHAGIAERRKVQTGAPKLQPGMPGSIAGDHIKRVRNPALPAAMPVKP